MAFYDAGDAMRGIDNFNPKQAVGFGLRALTASCAQCSMRGGGALTTRLRPPFLAK